MTKTPLLFSVKIGATRDEVTVFNKGSEPITFDRAALRKAGNKQALYDLRVGVIHAFRASLKAA